MLILVCGILNKVGCSRRDGLKFEPSSVATTIAQGAISVSKTEKDGLSTVLVLKSKKHTEAEESKTDAQKCTFFRMQAHGAYIKKKYISRMFVLCSIPYQKF
ncbi:hypothetical protein R6Q59_006259 [Mikania micrantha]